jgi:hypothetical protein
MRQALSAITAGLWRFDTTAEITLVAAAAHPAALAKWPLGTRLPIEGDTLATMVHRTALPARIDSYKNIAGPVAARVRAVGVRAAVGVPIIVDGSVRGLAAVGSVEAGPMPAETETRISRFTELIATAVVAGYREEQKRQLLGEATQHGYQVGTVTLYAVVVTAVVVGVRFVWFFTVPYFIRILDRRPSQRSRRRGPGSRMVMAWSGMRGAVSLAVALAVPLTTTAGAPFHSAISSSSSRSPSSSSRWSCMA